MTTDNFIQKDDNPSTTDKIGIFPIFDSQNANIFIYSSPPSNKWSIRIFGKDSDTLVWYIPDDISWWRRFISRIILGWYWEKIEEK